MIRRWVLLRYQIYKQSYDLSTLRSRKSRSLCRFGIARLTASLRRIGLLTMAEAGFYPEAAMTFWQRMEAAISDPAPEFLATQSAPQSRRNQNKVA